MASPMDRLSTELLCLICEKCEPSRIDVRYYHATKAARAAAKRAPPPPELAALTAISQTCKALQHAAAKSFKNIQSNVIIRIDMRFSDTNFWPSNRPFPKHSIPTTILQQAQYVEVIIPCLFRQSYATDPTNDHRQVKNLIINFHKNKSSGEWSATSRVWQTVVPPAKFDASLMQLASMMDAAGTAAVFLALARLNTGGGAEEAVDEIANHMVRLDAMADFWYSDTRSGGDFVMLSLPTDSEVRVVRRILGEKGLGGEGDARLGWRGGASV
ncbi:uncharacterized protein RCC_08722 [Ramularia collo-cygni]|uniref:Uncharacterized protein n=1 Tax=Ramularia collo-cygni TaxID=112498 RepID=A0A2D3VD95_9PEZI|nr:uncharacterized protein RCC_08722 [Ramularia collo-cygni]CZT23012.1 uncharacterized protein RCC_08722 [Ramularia collo-cygni]